MMIIVYGIVCRGLVLKRMREFVRCVLCVIVRFICFGIGFGLERLMIRIELIDMFRF